MEKPKYVNYYEPLMADTYYHVFNRTNNKEKLFKNNENRRFFLQQYLKYIHPFVKTFAYCLLPNHFHFLLSIKDEKTIEEIIQQSLPSEKTLFQRNLMLKPLRKDDIPLLMNHQFSRLFNSYAKSFNNMWGRNGNLFHRPFKRLEVESEIHFTTLIYYIHANPVGHKFRKQFTNYQWSSYQSLLSNKRTKLSRDQVLEWFGGKKAFEDFHNQIHEGFLKNQFSIE